MGILDSIKAQAASARERRADEARKPPYWDQDQKTKAKSGGGVELPTGGGEEVSNSEKGSVSGTVKALGTANKNQQVEAAVAAYVRRLAVFVRPRGGFRTSASRLSKSKFFGLF